MAAHSSTMAAIEPVLSPEDQTRATLNILEDFSEDKARMEETQQATFNILEDFCEDKGRLEEIQSAMLNLLEDFDAERATAEGVSRELRESIELLFRTNEVVEASNRELEAFNYTVSHDLRAPLRHILGFAKILSEEYGPTLVPEAQSYLERIQKGAKRMGQLVDDLLSLGRIGRQGMNTQVTDLKLLVEEVISESSPETAQRVVEWKVEDLPLLECDPVLMKQVFQNLLLNAVKFTSPRNRAIIEVGQQVQAGTPVMFVRDNGVGFNMKYTDKLFGVFQRLHKPEDFEGTGVGLATVQRIIHKHGGRIWAEAETDKGATFYFTLGDTKQTGVKPAPAKPTEVKNQTFAAGAHL